MDLILRKFVLLLLLTASCAPRPWAHDHAELNPEELCSHLRMCHSGSSDDGLPHGWHVHFEELEACLDDSAESGMSNLAAQPAASETNLERDLSPPDANIANVMPSSQPMRVGISPCLAATSGCELFQTFGALRI